MAKIPDRLVRGVSSLWGPAGAGVRWFGGAVVVCGQTLKEVLIQSGRRDLLASTIASVCLLGSVWLVFGGIQAIGVSHGMVCTSEQMGILALSITSLFEILIVLFLLKGLLRTMVALSRTSDELIDGPLSVGAALIPILLASLLRVGNTSLIACLYP